ncbi:MAG: CHASE domain-containing protein [Candidatus Binatia bacterium]
MPSIPSRVRQLVPALACVVLGVGVTIWAWSRTEERAIADLATRYGYATARVHAELQRRLDDAEGVLDGALGLVAASPTIDRARWRAFVTEQVDRRRLAALRGLAFVAAVPAADLGTFLTATRADGVPNYRIEPRGVPVRIPSGEGSSSRSTDAQRARARRDGAARRDSRRSRPRATPAACRSPSRSTPGCRASGGAPSAWWLRCFVPSHGRDGAGALRGAPRLAVAVLDVAKLGKVVARTAPGLALALSTTGPSRSRIDCSIGTRVGRTRRRATKHGASRSMGAPGSWGSCARPPSGPTSTGGKRSGSSSGGCS